MNAFMSAANVVGDRTGSAVIALLKALFWIALVVGIVSLCRWALTRDDTQPVVADTQPVDESTAPTDSLFATEGILEEVKNVAADIPGSDFATVENFKTYMVHQDDLRPGSGVKFLTDEEAEHLAANLELVPDSGILEYDEFSDPYALDKRVQALRSVYYEMKRMQEMGQCQEPGNKIVVEPINELPNAPYVTSCKVSLSPLFTLDFYV